MTSNSIHIAPVKEAIEGHVLAFAARQTNDNNNEPFHMKDLTDFVLRRTDGKVAPDSPGRILRQMKRNGEIDYVLRSRSASLYQFN
jgi:hypothetical protein